MIGRRVLAAAAVMVLAACNGDGSSASPSTTTSTTARESSGSSTTSPPEFSGDPGSPFCLLVAESGTRPVLDPFASGLDPAEVELRFRALKLSFEAFAAVAPVELEADLAALLAAVVELEAVLEEADYDFAALGRVGRGRRCVRRSGVRDDRRAARGVQLPGVHLNRRHRRGAARSAPMTAQSPDRHRHVSASTRVDIRTATAAQTQPIPRSSTRTAAATGTVHAMAPTIAIGEEAHVAGADQQTVEHEGHAVQRLEDGHPQQEEPGEAAPPPGRC